MEHNFEILDAHTQEKREDVKKVKILKRMLKIERIKGKAVVIIGPRRAGKTFYLYSIARELKEDFLFFDFEDIMLRDITLEDVFYYILSKKVRYVFIDEVQSKEGWQILVRSLLSRNIYVFISGSSSKLLSKEIATQLRGRTLSYLLLPFSFKEFLNAKEISLNEPYFFKKSLSYLKEYLNTGGFPEIVLLGYSKKIIKEYIDMIFFKDFVERKGIKSIRTARFVFEWVLRNYSKEISIKNIKNALLYIKIDSNLLTLSKYLEEIEDTFAVFVLSPFSHKLHIKESWPKKIYIIDTSIASLFELSENLGKKMENAVFLELKRRENEKPLQEIFYYKTKEGYEVDFLIKEGTKIKELVQVSYANRYEEINEREIRALLHAKEDLGLGEEVKLTVITWDYEDEREVEWWKKKGRIRFVPLWKWLLEG